MFDLLHVENVGFVSSNFIDFTLTLLNVIFYYMKQQLYIFETMKMKTGVNTCERSEIHYFNIYTSKVYFTLF